jgi:hypothetical protein
MPASRRRLSVLYFGLAAVQALAALAWLLRIPSDPKNAVLLGLSLERWAMLAVPAAVLGVAAAALYGALRETPRYLRLADRLTRRMRDTRLWGWVLLITALAGLAAGLFILIARHETPFVLAPRGALPELEIDAYYVDLSYFEIELYLPRLLPLLTLLAGLSIQTLALLPPILHGVRATTARLKATPILARRTTLVRS